MRVAVDGRGGGEDDLRAAAQRRLGDVEGPHHVHLEAEARVLDRRPEREHGQVEDTRRPLRRTRDRRGVGHVALEDADAAVADAGKVVLAYDPVEDDDFARATLHELLDHVRADEPRAARDEEALPGHVHRCRS
jgi:hypothetical protein